MKYLREGGREMMCERREKEWKLTKRERKK
jgi:hypothetical protein